MRLDIKTVPKKAVSSYFMNCYVKNLFVGFLTRSDTNRAVQPQNTARDLNVGFRN